MKLILDTAKFLLYTNMRYIIIGLFIVTILKLVIIEIKKGIEKDEK